MICLKNLRSIKNFFLLKILILSLVIPITALQAQTGNQTIGGKVIDSFGESLPGVNVVLKGTNIGVITDAQGVYQISVPDLQGSLVFSFIGFDNQEVDISGRASIDVTLFESVLGLDEVIVVGYGTVKKSDVTGAIVRVSNEDLVARPVNHATEALVGRAAGVDVTINERPGELGEITIRGFRSITAGRAVLYVVDGIPLMSASGIESLNPADIESIDILKDASATAIYGSRGANGVVLVTTKKGKSGEVNIEYSGSLSFQSMIWRSEYMNTEEYIDFIRWGMHFRDPTEYAPGNSPSLSNDGFIELFTADPVAWGNIQKGWAGSSWDPSKLEKFDWMGEVTQPNITQVHTVSGSGGTDNFKAYASIGFLDNQGTVKGQEYQRYTLRTNVEFSPKSWFRMGLNINATYSMQDYGQSRAGEAMSMTESLIFSAARIYPYALPYDSSGNLVPYPGGQSRVSNVIDEWKYSTNERETLRALASLYAEVDIFEGLKYRVNFGPDYRSFRNGVFNDARSVVRGGTAYARYGGNVNFSYTVDNLLYYNKTIDRHDFGLTLLQTASKWTAKNDNQAGQGVELPSQLWYALGALPSLDSWGSGLTERQLVSYMARLNYSLDEKYLLTLSGRWDGASQLADGNKWAFFPSAALAWRIEQESFMDDIDWVSQLKLRLGYGSTGNSSVIPYETKGGINAVQLPFGENVIVGYAPSGTLANPELGWETTTQINTGIDFSLWRGRLSGVIDVYKSNTTDLILGMSIPSVTGSTSTTVNVGETKNHGVDLSLTSYNVRTKDLTWQTTLNAAWQKDEIVSLRDGKQDMVDNDWFIGESIDVFYKYERLGVWKDTPEDLAEMAKFNANGAKFTPGSVRVKDQNGDYKLDATNDYIVLGNMNPRWIVGMNNSVNYKNFDFDLLLTGRLKYLRNVSEALTGMYGDQRKLDYWTPDNPNAEYQKPIRDEAGGDTYADTYYKDDSYIKIQSVSLGYRLPKNVLNTLDIGNLRVYAQINNAGMLWSNNNFLDSSLGTLHFNRSYVIGLDVKF